MPVATDDSTRPPASQPKRSRPLRLVVLLITLTLMVMVYLPLRISRANEHLKQALFSADGDGVRSALDGGADPDLQYTPSAATTGHLGSLMDAIRLLLHRSLRPAHNSKTALMQAANYSQTEIVTALLQHGAQVNTRLDDGSTALLLAASKHSPEILTALLAHGADLHAHTPDNTTALLLAAQAGQTENVRVLLQKGADIHEADHQFQTALSLATENRHEDTIQFLLGQGANERDLKGARLYPSSPNVQLIGNGQGRTFVTLNGKTTIVTGGRAPLTIQYAQPAAPPPLVFAAKYGSLTLMKFLWERTDPATIQRDSGNILNQTVQTGNAEAVRFLLDRHVPVNPSSPASTHLRVVTSRPNSYNHVYNPGMVFTPLHFAAALPTPDIARMLIARGANVNAEDMFGTTPLLAAAGGSHLATVRLLIEHGANVQAAERNSGQNALMRGTSDPEIVKLLLDHGLNVNARDRNGRTALMQCYNLKVAALLIARGADVNAQDSQGNTPLLAASRVVQKDMVALLLAHGANVNCVNQQGETPLSLAHRTRFTPMITLLTDAGAKR